MKNVAWVDVHGREYKMDDISDGYLINIIKFICKGGGYLDFLSEDVITNLFEEADRRGLRHKFNVKDAIIIYLERALEMAQA